MAIERISSPPFLDETAQGMLLALQGIRSAVQPANVYLDLDITLAVSGWSSEAPYTYNWTSDKINNSCSVKVSFLDGAEDTNPLYLEYEKTAGGIQFVAPVKPTAAIPVRVHIIYADANAITDVDDEMVSSSAISGAVNVKEALQNVDNKIASTNQALSNVKTSTVDGNNIGNVASMDALKTALVNLATSAGDTKTITFRFYPNFTDANAGFYSTSYGERMGTMYVRNSTRFTCIIAFQDGTVTRMSNNNGTWSVDQLALKSGIITDSLTPETGVSIAVQRKLKIGNLVTYNLAITTTEQMQPHVSLVTGFEPHNGGYNGVPTILSFNNSSATAIFYLHDDGSLRAVSAFGASTWRMSFSYICN